MSVFEKEFTIPAVYDRGAFFSHASESIQFQLPTGAVPLRFAVTQSDEQSFTCEGGVIQNLPQGAQISPESIF